MQISQPKDYLFILEEWIALLVRVKNHLGDIPEEDTNATELAHELNERADVLIDVFGDGTRVNPFTVPLNLADSGRDRTVARMSKFLDGARYHENEEIAQAAAALYELLRKHEFGATNQSFEVQTARTEALLKDLGTAEMKANAQLAGINLTISKLRDDQDTFEDINEKKRDYQSSKSDIKAAELVSPISRCLFELIVHLNSRERRHPGSYAALNKKLNDAIEQINTKALARNSRVSGDSDDVTQDSGTDTEPTQALSGDGATAS